MSAPVRYLEDFSTGMVVRPGVRLRVRVRIHEVKRSRSRPEMGTIRQTTEVLNQKDEVVMSTISIGMVRARTMPENSAD